MFALRHSLPEVEEGEGGERKGEGEWEQEEGEEGEEREE